MTGPPLNSVKTALIIFAALIILPAVSVHSQLPGIFQEKPFDNDLRVVYNLQRMGNFKAALAYLDNLKSKYGEDLEILNLYKNIYQEAKMYPELESVIRKQLLRSPDNPVHLAELGNARFLQDDYRGADSLWALALEKGETNQTVYIYVANFKLRYGDYSGAIETFLSARRRFDIPDMFSSELANIYESQMNYPAAAREYLIRLVKAPDRFLSLSSKILALVEDSEDDDSIIDAVKDMIDSHKNSDVLHEMLGDIYIKTGRMKLAFDTYKDLGKNKKDDGESLYRFAERCVDFKAYDTAIDAVDNYLSVSSNLRRKDMALLLKGKALKYEGYNDRALVVLQGILQDARDTRFKGEAGFLIGIIHAENNRCAPALAAWENSLDYQSYPELKEKVIFEMARCQLRLGSYGTAESLLTIIAQGKNEGEIKEKSQFLLGDLALFKNNYQQAYNAYVNIIKTYPRGDFANDAITRVSVISTIGIDSSGITADNSVLDLYAGAVEANMLGNYEGAVSLLLNEKLAGSPIGENALFYAGTICADAGLGDKAIGLLKSYIEKYPEGLFLDRVYLILGDQYIENPETFELGREAYNMILEAFQEGPVTELARERLRLLESQDKIG